MSLGMVAVDSYEFVVHDLERSRRFYVDRLDFREVARSTTERNRRTGEESAVFRAGKVQVQVSSPLHQRSAAAKYLSWHPDGIRAVSFRVKSVADAWRFLEERGATFLGDPEEHADASGKWKAFGVASALGDVEFRFVEREGSPPFAAGFDVVTPPDEGNRFQFAAVDHITCNTLTMKPYVNWLRDVLGWEQFWDVQFHTDDVRKGGESGSGLKSIVMRDPHSGVKFATNEPLKPFFEQSQITKFVEDHRGAGVQHVAFITPKIIPAVEGLRERGIKFLATPAVYYDALPSRFAEVGLGMSTIKEPIDVLAKNGILVDGANERYMLQIFLQEGGLLYDDPRAGPFFYEVIQRAGDPGFGAGNFRALFESIERDQFARQRATDSAT
jgi:4-hydroxyphenylpyruvate dioxygenase